MRSIKNVKADVHLKRPGNKRNLCHLSFDLPEKEISLTDTLMREFSDLNLTMGEKNKLSREHRQYLCFFKSITEKEIKCFTDQLIKTLKTHRDQDLIIKATSGGSLLCLAAIFSGKLPENKNWRFELEEFPLPLFPQEFIKDKAAAEYFNIAFRYHHNSWIKSFPSLKRAPKYMTLQANRDIREFQGWEEEEEEAA